MDKVNKIKDKADLILSLVREAQRETAHIGYIEHFGEIRLKAMEIKQLLKSIDNEMLNDIKERIELCLKDTNKKKEKGMPEGMDYRAEVLGYKTSLECIKRTKEKFALSENLEDSE